MSVVTRNEENFNSLLARRSRVHTECLCRWGNDDTITKFSNNYDNWFNSIDEDYHDILISLLSKFNYYSKEIVANAFVSLHEKLKQSYNININNCRFSFIPSQDGHMNSSYQYILDYSLANNLSKFYFAPELLRSNLTNLDYVIFIDDCSGSGNTLIDFLEKSYDLLKAVKIVILLVHVMVDAETRIREYAKKRFYSLEIIAENSSSKAFSSYAFENDEVAMINRSKFEVLSNRLLIPSHSTFGYAESESLIAFYSNTPNNTLGLFQYKTKYNSPFFPRKHEEKPNYIKMNADKAQRRIERYNNSRMNRNA